MTRSGFLVPLLIAAAPLVLSAQAEMDLDRLVRRDDVYLQPTTLAPYSGPVVATWDQGTVRLRGTLKDGRWDGDRVSYYLSGRISARETFRDGVLHGPAEAYFKSGQLSARESYTEGRLDGPYETYWVRGAVAERGAFANGTPCGAWVSFGDTISYPPCRSPPSAP